MKSVFRFLLFVLSLFNIPMFVNAQNCSGTWGNPIVNQTFGEGTNGTDLYGPLSTYAPGVTTTTTFLTSLSGSLSDGESCITSSPRNSGQGTAWIQTTDHTGDPYGLMMLINAPSTAATVFFEYTMDNLCPNTVLQVSIWILNVNDPSISTASNYQYPNMQINLVDPTTNTVIANTSTGDVACDEAWHNYTLVFNNGSSSSVKLQLVNYSVGSGYGNDLALDDITVRPCVPISHVSPELDTIVCQPSVNIPFNANISGNVYSPANYLWQYSSDSGATWTDAPGGATTNSGYNFSANTSDVYWMRFLVGPPGFNGNTNCAGVSDTSIVKLITTIPTYTPLDTTFCHSGLVQLKARNTADSEQFQWEYSTNNGATWTANEPSSDSTYTFVAFNTGTTLVRFLTYPKGLSEMQGCKRISDTSVIKVNPIISAYADATDVTCFGKADGKINVHVTEGAAPLTFSLAAAQPVIAPFTTNTGGLFTGLDTGHYTIAIADADKACRDTLTDIAIAQPTPLAIQDTSTISPTCLMNNDGGLTVAAQGGSAPYFYELQPANLFSYDGTFTRLMQDTYTVTVHDNNHCTITEKIPVTAQPCCKVLFPDAFTPNRDGKNDTYHPVTSAAINSMDLHIFNRYGQEIYHGEGSSAAWDGTYGGAPADINSYFYLATYICADTNQQVVKKGSFVLIR